MIWDLIGCCGPHVHEDTLLTNGKEIYYFYFKDREEMAETIKNLECTHWMYLMSVPHGQLRKTYCNPKKNKQIKNEKANKKATEPFSFWR
jgi:hypothetical protein